MSVFGIGTVVIDNVVVLPSHPEVDTKSPVISHWQQIGGPVPVALSVLSHYGVATQFMGRWGNDPAGNQIRQGLGQRGIDLTPSSSHDEWTSGFAHVWTEEQTGKRTIAFHRGSFPPIPTEELRLELLDSSLILHLDGAMPEVAIAAARHQQANGRLVVLDAGSKKPGMEELLKFVDVLIASNLFCESWFGDVSVSMQEIAALGPKSVVRTHAEDGATYYNANDLIHVPALQIEPVDTNGAGDVFCGAYLYGMVQKWNPPRILSFANSVAGFSCRHRGNSTYPVLGELPPNEVSS